MLIELCEQDQKALGLDDATLDYDLTRLTLREATRLQDVGFLAPALWSDEILSTPGYTDDAGWTRIWTGAQVPGDKDGDPPVEVRVNFEAWRALVWLALARTEGRFRPWADIDADLRRLRWRAAVAVEEEEGGEGKDPSIPGTESGSTSEPESGEYAADLVIIGVRWDEIEDLPWWLWEDLTARIDARRRG